jgi:hypothetical protein
VTDTKRERRNGCNRRKKGWKVRRGVGCEDIRKEEWWNDQCGEGMRRLHDDLPATTTWEAKFLLREGLSREVMGKWMANEAFLAGPWKRRKDGSKPC